MIENFSYKNIKNGITRRVNLKGEKFFYDEPDSNIPKQYYSEGETGILWYVNNEVIEMSKKDFDIVGIPTLDMKHVIVIIEPRKVEYPMSQAYIYDEYGNMIEEIPYPKLISDFAKRLGRPAVVFFDAAHWKKIGSEYYLTISIRFNRDWYERRIYDFDKREFRECVGSGRI